MSAERIRTLLLSADNQLKHGDAGRLPKVRAALEEARALAAAPDVDDALRGLVDRRIAAIDQLEAGGGGTSG